MDHMESEQRTEMNHVTPEQERLYMPSNWVVRVPSDQAVPLHVKLITEETARVKRTLTDCRLGVKFGPGEGDKVDIYGEKTSTTGKMMVFISGGYWLALSGDISSWTVMPLVRSGHSVAVLDYTRCPGQDLAAITRQVERGLAWLLEEAVTRGVSVFLSGHSAGSHLAAMALSSALFSSLPLQLRQTVRGVIHLSGIFELSPLLQTSVNVPAMNLSPSSAEELSPATERNLARLRHAGQGVRHWLVVGEHDSPAFKLQARQYADLLTAGGLEARVSEQEGEDHFSLVERLKDQDYSLSQERITSVWWRGSRSKTIPCHRRSFIS